MANSVKLPLRTASSDRSIWNPLNETIFRQSLVALSKATNTVPTEPGYNTWDTRFHQNPTSSNTPHHVLPIQTERQLVDSLAFLAAYREGSGYVSAVCIEEQLDSSGSVVRLAMNEGVPLAMMTFFTGVFDLLQMCAKREVTLTNCRDVIFHDVVQFEKTRLHSRLRSSFWEPAPYYLRAMDPLRTPLHVLMAKEAAKQLSNPLMGPAKHFWSTILALSSSFQSLNQVHAGSLEELDRLKTVVRSTFDFCTDGGTKTFKRTIESSGLDYQALITKKYIRPLDIIGHYWRCCDFLSALSYKYPSLFSQINLSPIRPYGFSNSPIFRDGKPGECFVHAEVQLIIFYELNQGIPVLPRVIGCSKVTCYLCNLFIEKHGGFAVYKTHGRLFERWTVPDLSEYSSQTVATLRRTLSSMNANMIDLTRLSRQLLLPFRPFPATSTVSQDTIIAISVSSSTVSTVTVQQRHPGITDTQETHIESEAEIRSADSVAAIARLYLLQFDDSKEYGQRWRGTVRQQRPLWLATETMKLCFELDEPGRSIVTVKCCHSRGILDLGGLGASEAKIYHADNNGEAEFSLGMGIRKSVLVHIKTSV